MILSIDLNMDYFMKYRPADIRNGDAWYFALRYKLNY
jgi:hypothetical protein